jgi:hypothetical protein
MYGLPKDIDLSFFVGQQLLQICLGEYQVLLNFDDVSVNMNNAEYSFRGTRREAGGATGGDLVSLLGKTCTAAVRVGEGDLRLEFGEEVVVFHDSNAPYYESYTINNVDGVIVV